MLLAGSGQSGDGFVVAEGKNVPTSGRFNALRNPAEVLQSLDSIGAKTAVPERLNPLAIFVLAMNPAVAERPLKTRGVRESFIIKWQNEPKFNVKQ